MAVRANQLGVGGAGVSDGLLDSLAEALNEDFVPVAHELGSLGTGDLTILAEIGVALIDRYDVQLGPRDGIGFMSSNAASIGHAALIVCSARRLLPTARRVAALCFLAAGADPSCSTPGYTRRARIQGRWRSRPDAGPAWTRHRRATGESGVDPPFRIRFRSGRSQVEVPLGDAARLLERVLAVELNAAAENALIDPDGPAVPPNANFYAGRSSARSRRPQGGASRGPARSARPG